MNATSIQATTSRASTSPLGNPWTQLIIGIVCMVMIANLQYGWTLFVGPIDAKYHWGKASIQVAFTIFVVLETWLVPVEGWLVDKFGPRWITVIGGVLCGIAWSVNSVADSLPMLYFAAALGGIGAGAVYGTCIGNAVKWFPDRRGLAAGLTAAGFGMGSAATIVPIASMIKASGYQHTFLTFGLFQGVVVVILGFLILAPPASLLAAAPKLPSAAHRQTEPMQMVRTPTFWVMYAMFVMMAVGGLMAVAQLAPIAKDFKIAEIPVSLVGLTLPALTFALTIDRILNGLCRPFFGWVSDHLGRENTMLIAFALEGFGIVLLANLGTNPVYFVILSGIVFFGLGRDLQSLPGYLHRHVRGEVRDGQCRFALYGERDGSTRHSLYQHLVKGRRVASGVHDRSRAQYHRSTHGRFRAQAHARRLQEQSGPAGGHSETCGVEESLRAGTRSPRS